MNNENFFEASDFKLTVTVEKNMELHDWMLNENLFQVDQNEEMPLEIEAWMTLGKVWEI